MSERFPHEGWFYFGCRGARTPGHYLHAPGMRSVYGSRWEKLRMDGQLAPQLEREPYVAALSRLGGWGVSALSFWDYTGDSRGGSNSTFFAPGLTISAEDIVVGSRHLFPQVWARLPEIRLPVQDALARPDAAGTEGVA